MEMTETSREVTMGLGVREEKEEEGTGRGTTRGLKGVHLEIPKRSLAELPPTSRGSDIR